MFLIQYLLFGSWDVWCIREYACQFARTLLRAALIFRGQKNQIMNIVFIKQCEEMKEIH